MIGLVDFLWYAAGAAWLIAAALGVRNLVCRYAYARERRTAARLDHDEWLTTHRKTWRDPLPPVFDRPWSEPHLRREP